MIGLSVAVVGLFAILVGIIFMVSCARRKIERERLERRRQIAERQHDAMGPYGGYLGQGMPEPPPRYSSHPDLSISTSSFNPYPLCEVPPPLYTPVDKPTSSVPTYNEPPPTYSSYPDLRSALVPAQMDRSDSVVSQGVDNPGLDVNEESFEKVKSEEKLSQSELKESGLSRAGTCNDLSNANTTSATDLKTSVPKHYNSKADLTLVDSNGALGSQNMAAPLKRPDDPPTSRRTSANSLYEGLTTADRDLLQNIMMTVPSEVLRRRGSNENVQSTVDLRPQKVDKDRYKSEPAVYRKNIKKSDATAPSLNQRPMKKQQAKSHSHLEMVQNTLPPLRHAISQDVRYISSSELANPWNADMLQSLDFQEVQPACVSTPKQTSPRRLQTCLDINISQDSLDVDVDNHRGSCVDEEHNRHDINHHQGASKC